MMAMMAMAMVLITTFGILHLEANIAKCVQNDNGGGLKNINLPLVGDDDYDDNDDIYDNDDTDDVDDNDDIDDIDDIDDDDDENDKSPQF